MIEKLLRFNPKRALLLFLFLLATIIPPSYSQILKDHKGKLDDRYAWVLRYGGTPRSTGRRFDWGSMTWVYSFDFGQEEWSSHQKRIVQAAFVILRDRVLSDPVRTCIQKNVKKYGGLSPDTAWQKL